MCANSHGTSRQLIFYRVTFSILIVAIHATIIHATLVFLSIQTKTLTSRNMLLGNISHVKYPSDKAEEQRVACENFIIYRFDS